MLTTVENTFLLDHIGLGSLIHHYNYPYYSQKLPIYIASVNWGDVTQCLDVYSLLNQLTDVTDTIPIEVYIASIRKFTVPLECDIGISDCSEAFGF